MAIDKTRASAHLNAFDFSRLFIEELGWDRPASRQVEHIEIGGEIYALTPVAEKRLVGIFHCASMPESQTRKKIERELTKRKFEHLIIFTDAARTQQIWQWVERIKGKSAAVRDHTWRSSQSPELMLQKLERISFPLEGEESLALSGVVTSLRDAFTREQITRRFFGEFQTQHAAFLGFIQGLEAATDRQWYASLMLNRLMFVYFIQRKGFLDDDTNYLRNRLARVRAEQGKGQFHGFYRLFLLTLFHGGLATPANARDATANQLLGTIPYLNGGLFEPHILEAEGNNIEIADEAFDAVFKFFDTYDWTLDTRAISRSDGKEINPDVLGHIFEKYINQKQMGAYYTKEDITDYITKNTVVPWLFQNAIGHDKVAFEPGGPVWRMLSDSPDTYIYPAVKKGVELPLPDNIAAGISDVAKRGDWNKTASPEYGLPTEIWREVVARRERYETIRAKAAAGEIVSIDDFITYNLDISQFAVDAIQYAESADLVKAFWKGIRSITVLDPACGSGAFLFAALGILHSLYDACLKRMQEFVDSSPPAKGPFPPHKKFREVLSQVARHPNRDYFIYKSIIIANLYGVDIMDEAVEICKLRLFLKLAAQLERADQIEPLPDIDFNIRAGNSVLGFRTIEDALEKSKKAGLQFDNTLSDIQDKSDDLDQALKLFRRQQTELGGNVSAADKAIIRDKLTALKERLNECFIGLYAPSPPQNRDAWSWQRDWIALQNPFHWVIDFHDIVSHGGFSVIIGNPPYVEIDKANSRKALLAEYATCLERWSRDEDLYTLFVERSLSLASRSNGAIGLILPLSVAFSTKRPFASLRSIISAAPGSWLWSHFDRIPSSLFGNDVRTRCSIGIYRTPRGGIDRTFLTTSLKRWGVDQRDTLFDGLRWASFAGSIRDRIPKLADDTQASGLDYLLSLRRPLGLQLGRPVSANTLISIAPNFPAKSVFVAGTAYNWFPAWRSIPATTDDTGRPSVPARAIGFSFETESDADLVFALLCSSLGYWWWAVASDGFNLKKWLVESFPLSPAAIPLKYRPILSNLGAELRSELERNYVYKDNQGRKGNFYLPSCEAITKEIDESIDRALEGIDSGFIRSVQEFNSSFSRIEDGIEDDAD